MTDMFVQGIIFVKRLLMLVFPEIPLVADILINLNKYIEVLLSLLSKVNFLVPLPDIFAIIGIVIWVKVTMFGYFIVNWVIRRVADFIP